MKSYFASMRKALLIGCLLLPLACRAAEWIELRDGSKVEGKILSVTSASVLMEVQTTPTIREEKSFERGEVVKIQRAGLDDLAFAEIESIRAPETADNPAVYDALLEQKIRPFMKSYAYSKHMPAVRKIAATLEEERARIASGEVKVDGNWVNAEQRASGGPEEEGRLQLAKMKSATDPAAALSIFAEIEKDSPGSSSYPAAVRLARENIGKLRDAVTRARAELSRREKEQTEGLKLASPDRRALLEKGIAQEQASIQSQLDRAKQSGRKWPPIVPDAKTLDQLSALADSEETRLRSVDDAAMDSAVVAVRKAGEELAAGSLDAAKASLAEAERLWPRCVMIAPMKESLSKAQADAARAAAAQGSAKP